MRPDSLLAEQAGRLQQRAGGEFTTRCRCCCYRALIFLPAAPGCILLHPPARHVKGPDNLPNTCRNGNLILALQEKIIRPRCSACRNGVHRANS
jgi:hypothetical protein